jgi:RNA-binding protein
MLHDRDEVTPSISQLRNKAVLLEPSVRIGKNGITSGIIQEIRSLLDKRGLVKIKILKGALEQEQKEELVEKTVKGTESILVQQVGLTFTLYKQKRGGV